MRKKKNGEYSEMTPKQKVWLGRLMRYGAPLLAVYILFTFHFEDFITGFWSFRVVAIIALLIAGPVGKRMERKNTVVVKQKPVGTDIQTILKEEFDRVVYDAKRFLPREDLDSEMGFPFSYDRVTGRDYVSADYHGCGLELSDICLQERNPQADEFVEQSGAQTRFRGVWLILHLKKSWPAEVSVRSREHSAASDDESGEAAFEQVFEVTAEDPAAADAVLTPKVREYLLYLYGLGKQKPLYLHFRRDGTVHVAMDLGRRFFSSASFDVNPEHIRLQLVRQLRAVQGLIEACTQA